jgi:hypothetical protein
MEFSCQKEVQLRVELQLRLDLLRVGDPECGQVPVRLAQLLASLGLTLIVCAVPYLDYRVTISFAFCRLS